MLHFGRLRKQQRGVDSAPLVICYCKLKTWSYLLLRLKILLLFCYCSSVTAKYFLLNSLACLFQKGRWIDHWMNIFATWTKTVQCDVRMKNFKKTLKVWFRLLWFSRTFEICALEKSEDTKISKTQMQNASRPQSSFWVKMFQDVRKKKKLVLLFVTVSQSSFVICYCFSKSICYLLLGQQ